MWKEVPRTRNKEVMSSHLVESSRPSLTSYRLQSSSLNFTVRLSVRRPQQNLFLLNNLKDVRIHGIQDV